MGIMKKKLKNIIKKSLSLIQRKLPMDIQIGKIIEIGLSLVRGRLPIDIHIRKNPSVKLIKNYQDLFRNNGFNVCYNNSIREDYDSKKKNILIAIESPAIIEYHKWLDPKMEFIAEISFANFYNLKNYYCPRELYAGNDFYINLNPSRKYKKERLVSLIYSKRQHLEGHKLRHEIANRFQSRIELFGSGIENSREKKGISYYYPNTNKVRKIFSLDRYMYQIVIENGKHPEYVSEKFFDCLKTRTIPIYWGGEKAVRTMGFDIEGIFFFDTIEDLEISMEEKVSKSTYNKKIHALEFNLNRLIEIRNNLKLLFFLNTLQINYFHSTESYHNKNYNALALKFD